MHDAIKQGIRRWASYVNSGLAIRRLHDTAAVLSN